MNTAEVQCTEPEQPQYFVAPNTVYDGESFNACIIGDGTRLCRNCAKRKGLCRQHQHRGDGGNNVGDDDNEGNTTTVPDYSRKKRARKKSSPLPRTNEKSENVVIKGDIERSMTLLMELMKQSAKSRSYLRQMKEKNRANSSNFLLNNSRNGSSNFNNGNGNEDFVEGNIGISSKQQQD